MPWYQSVGPGVMGFPVVARVVVRVFCDEKYVDWIFVDKWEITMS